MNIEIFCWMNILHLMNRIQSKNHKIGTTAVSNISLYCIDDNIYTLNNVFDILDLVS